MIDIESIQLQVGDFCLRHIRKCYPKVKLIRNESIGLLGGWDIRVDWFIFSFLYRTTDQRLKQTDETNNVF